MDEYKHGDFNRICDRTGFKHKASDTRMQWDGLIVHKDEWEERHPQDFVRAKADDQSVHHPRPETAPVFLNPNDVTEEDL